VKGPTPAAFARARTAAPASQKLLKLRAMSAKELASRVAYKGFCTIERGTIGGLRPPAARLHRALRRDLRQDTAWARKLMDRRESAVSRFFTSVKEADAVRAQFGTTYASNRAKAISCADEVLEQRIEFFGRIFTFSGAIPWHSDPVHGREWPRVYHREVPTSADAAYGDVKYVWELNRHQFLIDLGKAWFLTHDERYPAKLMELVGSWISDNPYGIGVSWACALEPAFRTFSWLWAYHLTADAPLKDEEHVAWLASFYDHGRFLYRHLEHYTSPYNHLIGEAAALYMLGVAFPEFSSAQAWRVRGRRVLEQQINRQFHSDGGSVEQSPFYHHATVGFYLLAATLGRVNGEEFDRSVWLGIERAIEFSMYLQQPDGTTPRIGGADDGKPLRMEHRSLWDFRFVPAIGAALFRRGDFKTAAGEFAEDALWLLGTAGQNAFEGVIPSRPPASVSLHGSGYFVMRSGWDTAANYVCFDCGAQADGLRRDNVPSAAHGHADCLSTIVWLSGRPVLADAGVYSYNGARPWVEHFRRTAAHNTLLVDGADQAEYRGKMNWARTYAPQLERFDFTPGRWRVSGSHDGYTRLNDPVTHRRTVYLRHANYVVICDEVLCQAPHHIELIFQFAPGVGEMQRDSRLVVGDAELAWTSNGSLTPLLYYGGYQPHEGWVAESLGVRTPAPRLVLSGDIDARGISIVTVIADLSVAPDRSRLSVSSNSIDVVLPRNWRSPTSPSRERILPRAPGAGSHDEPVTFATVQSSSMHLALLTPRG
jgi:hypothetical protein